MKWRLRVDIHYRYANVIFVEKFSGNFLVNDFLKNSGHLFAIYLADQILKEERKKSSMAESSFKFTSNNPVTFSNFFITL